jgi:hypothetical protein
MTDYKVLRTGFDFKAIRQGRREGGGGGGGGQIAPGPQVLRGPRNFLLGPSHFLGEIFPRKGQDIWVFLDKVPKFGTKN